MSHLHFVFQYQPDSHYWAIQGIETAIFLGLGLLLLGLTVMKLKVGEHDVDRDGYIDKYDVGRLARPATAVYDSRWCRVRHWTLVGGVWPLR